MAWTTPMTAVANSVFTAAQFNTYVRDNLNETMVAKATAAGQYFVSDGNHSVAPRTPSSSTNNTLGSFTSTSWTNIGNTLSSVTTGTEALVHISCWLRQSTADAVGTISYAVSGATTLSPDDHNNRINWDGVNTVQQTRMGSWSFHKNLVAGSNTFTMQGTTAIAGTTLTYNRSHIIVIPIN